MAPLSFAAPLLLSMLLRLLVSLLRPPPDDSTLVRDFVASSYTRTYVFEENRLRDHECICFLVCTFVYCVCR